MGWWPLNLETGGIAWGGKGLKEGLMWGDSVADIVDEELSQFLKSVDTENQEGLCRRDRQGY